MALSDTALASIAKNAGLSGDSAAIAVAIALAESGGNPNAHNKVPPDNSYGLWQINMLGALGPARRRQFNLRSNEELFDPAINAKAMMAISNNGKNWRPWTTYTRGNYLRYLSRARAAVGNSGAGQGASGGYQNVGTGSLGDLASKVTDSNLWGRVGKFILGFALVLFGFGILVAGSATGKVGAIVKTVGKVAGK